MYKGSFVFIVFAFLYLSSCTNWGEGPAFQNDVADSAQVQIKQAEKKLSRSDIVIEKDITFDKYTLADSYPYKDTLTRSFQWNKIKESLFLLDSIQAEHSEWAILQNYKNRNGEAPLVKNYVRNEYTRISDTLGVERYQSVPLYTLQDTVTGERYGRDGFLVKHLGDVGSYIKVSTPSFPGEWLVPKKYVKAIAETKSFEKAIFVDVTNQNIATLEKIGKKWLVRSMNPATTGMHKPPYQQETPEGIFVIQENKPRMVFLKDGSVATGGYAPFASRFTNGAYIHGIPVNTTDRNSKKIIEFSSSLGTTPRSHMCVRNATSHAKFIYEWAPPQKTIVFVIG